MTSPRAARLEAQVERALSRRSSAMFMFFGRIFERALKRDFHAVRLSRAGGRPAPQVPKLVIYSNHPAWWDAMVYVLIGTHLLPGRPGYAPIDARMLERYGFMARIGALGIAQHSAVGAAFFLAACRGALARGDGFLCVAAQGRFADVRERPVRLARGLAHLAGLVPDATLLPLAIEYPFWDERKPELLLRFGEPVPASDLSGLDVSARDGTLALRLERTMDALAAEAIARRADAFETLLAGRAGVGGVYDLWRAARARLRNERFSPAHGDPR